MKWYSEDYIGDGGDLIEVSSLGEGRNQTRLRGKTIATRIGVYSNNGITVIVSQLHIVASEQFPMSSVTCRFNAHGRNKTINFNITGMKSDIMYYPAHTLKGQSNINSICLSVCLSLY
jgi:hypothetical protein